MGVYRSYALSVTAEVFVNSTESIYNGNVTDASKSMFALSNLGYVMTKNIGKGGRGWKFYQISLGMNRLNNYNGAQFMQGMNMDHSRIDVYINQTYDLAESIPDFSFDNINSYDPFYAGPAWDTYLTDTIRTENGLEITSPVPQGGILQTQSIATKGSNNEWLASFSANYDDILYIGITLGLPNIRYFRESVYTETDPNNVSPDFNTWSVEEYLRTTGWGVNAKIGILIRPVDFMRLGLAIHTPTYYWNMRDYYSTVHYSELYTISTGEYFQGYADSPEGEYRYKLTTPARALGSMSFIIKKIGFITGEYEFVNYSTAKFRAGDYGFGAENDSIKSYFTTTHNFRIGTEWRISKISLRAGYALYASPYANNQSLGSRQNITFGIGYQAEKLRLDFAYVRAMTKEEYLMYNYENNNFDPPIVYRPNPVENTITNQHFVLSLRYLFN
jgi:hypothetical protein